MSAIQPRTATLTIYQGDDLARIDELHQAVVRAENDATTRLGHEQPAGLAEAEEHDEFVREAEQRAVKVVVKALGRRRWRELVGEHPPREGNEADEGLGVNDETFGDALVAASVISPEMSDGEMTDFLDSLRDADFQRIYMQCFWLNRGQGEAPKASLASELTSRNAETSRSRETGERR